MAPKINLIRAKSILTKSGLPGSQWVINPYNGCLFGCWYCYAAQIARWKHPDEEWGSYLDIKINAPEVLVEDLQRQYRKLKTRDFGTIFLSSVTDPYVGLEAKYKLTKGCLEKLIDFGYKGLIAVQTKSALVTRDIDLFKKLKKVKVGLTITALEDKVSQFLEVKAPVVSLRFKALERLHKAGIETYAFVGPILPYVLSEEKNINLLLDKLEKVGVTEVWFEHINLNPRIKQRLFNYLKRESPVLIPQFEKADKREYRNRLDEMIKKTMKGRKLKMALGRVIHHNTKSSSKSPLTNKLGKRG